MKRRLALAAVAATAAGAALAFAQGGSAPAEPVVWTTRPEVPGAARTLVPFGIETTTAGPRAWALGVEAGATVVLQRAPGGGWTAAHLAGGRPVGGEKAPQHAAELSADGHGAVLLAETNSPAKLFTRAPGAAFTAAPDPAAALLPDEQLVGGDASTSAARTLLAVTDAAALVAPTTADGTGRAVLRLTTSGWQREAIASVDPVHPVALAAAGPGREWLLATALDRVVLFRQDAGQWVPMAFDDELLTTAAKVEVSPPPADPLTATADGLWIDLRVTPSGATAPIDVTEHLTVTEPPVATATSTSTATATSTPPPPPRRRPSPRRPRPAGRSSPSTGAGAM